VMVLVGVPVLICHLHPMSPSRARFAASATCSKLDFGVSSA
jgi:hypothetical protein